MKSIIRRPLLALGLALSLITAHASAQNPADPYKKDEGKGYPAPAADKTAAPAQAASEVPPLLQITAEWVEVPTADALPLLRDGQAPNSPGLIEKIRELEKQGKASVVDVASVVANPGQRAASEGVKESIYPTTYLPLAQPNLGELNLSGNQIKESHLAISTESHATPQPNEFTMRPTGARLEVDAVMNGSSPELVDLSVNAELTSFAGTVAHGTVRLGGENVPAAEQPVFITSKAQTAVTLHTGRTILASVQSPHDADGNPDRSRKWLILLHVVAFPAK